MGKRIKSTGIILDASSTGSAPVSPAGTVALRAKSDSTQFQYSANGGAWTDFTGGGAGTVRLDQVLDPNVPGAPPRIKTFEMADHQLVYHFTTTEPEDSFVIESVSPGIYAGSLLLLRCSGAATEKFPLRIEGRGAFYLCVDPLGRVAIGRETGLANKLTVEHTNTGGDETGGIQCNIFLAAGNTATSTSTGVFTLSDDGNTTALTEARVMNVGLSRGSTAVSSPSLVTYLIYAISTTSANTGTCYGLWLRPTIANFSTLTRWEGIHIAAPNLVTGGVVTTKYSIVTESGAGNVGFGTTTPVAQLHVVGAVQNDQSTGQVFTISKNIAVDESPQIEFKTARGTGTTPVNADDPTGRIIFYGYRGSAYQAMGYLVSTYNEDFGAAGFVSLGAGPTTFDKARVNILQTDAGSGAVTLFAGTTGPYFQVQTAGFQFSHGGTGSVYYKDVNGYFVSLDIVTSPSDLGKVLTVTNVSGNLYPRWAAGGGGGTPASPVSTLQYNNAGAFGAVTDSLVSGADVTLGGALTVRNGASSTDQNVLVSASGGGVTRLLFTDYRDSAAGSQLTFERGRLSGGVHADLNSADVVSRILWRGQLPSVGVVMMGYIHCWNDLTEATGSRLDLGAGASFGPGNTSAKVSVSESHTGISGSVTLFGGGGSTNFFQVATSGFRFSHGATGSIFYRDVNGYFVSLDIATSPSDLGKVLTVTNVSGNLYPRWAAAAGGGAPASPVNTLQFNSAGAFGAVTSSVVSGANLELGGDLTLKAISAGLALSDTRVLYFDRLGAASANIGDYYVLGAISFRGKVGGTLTQFGYLGTRWDPGYGGEVALGALTYTDSLARLVIKDTGTGINSASLFSGSHFFQLQNGGTGFRWSLGSQGAMYYQNDVAGTLFLTALAAGSSSQYLKGGAVPSWGSLDASHITAGTLALARGGTGSSLTDPGADRIMFWDDSAGIVDWLIPGTGLTITDKTMTAGSSAVFTSGNKALADNTRTAIFSVSFDAADHLGVGGIVHFTVIAKQTSGSTQIQVYRVSATFTAAHYGSSTGFGRWGNTYNTDGVTSTGSIAFTFDCNGTNHPSYASGSNLFTFYITANSDLTTPTGMIIYFNIEYTGEKAITLV